MPETTVRGCRDGTGLASEAGFEGVGEPAGRREPTKIETNVVVVAAGGRREGSRAMIEAQNLGRRYGDFVAVHGVSFSIREGEIVGILGPNGAGKTTTIRMITGFLPPSSGRVTVGGKDLFSEPGAARRDLGYLPENVAIYPEMRVSEYLAYRAALEGMSRAEAKAAIPRTLERCLLADVGHQIVGTLSKGYRQRVGLAAAILHNPKVLVLDEPTVGLDPKQIIAIRELIRELGRSHTLLLSTHILPEVELLCSRVLIIDRGRVIAEGTPQELRERWRGNVRLRIQLEGQPAAADEALAGLPSVARVSREGERFVVEHDPAHDLRAEVFRLAVARGWTLLELAEARASLEDIFVRLTTRDLAAEPEAGAAANDSAASEEVAS
jgi:ABC-2 type transport system ATP-binding protein